VVKTETVKPIRQRFTAPNGMKVSLRMRFPCKTPTYFFRIGEVGRVQEVIMLHPD